MINKSFKKTLVASSIAAMLYATSSVAMAESFGGLVKGQVTSASSQALANVLITLKHKTKGITRTITTNANGRQTL